MASADHVRPFDSSFQPGGYSLILMLDMLEHLADPLYLRSSMPFDFSSLRPDPADGARIRDAVDLAR